MAIEGFPIQLSITCRACRQPLPVNALSRTAWCANCGNSTALDEDFWTTVFGPDELAEALELEPGSGTQKSVFMGGAETQIAYGRRLPRCQSCQSELDPNVFQAAADYGAMQCGGCGEHIRARHADDLVRALVPQALYVLNEGPTATDAREEMGATQAVTFACTQCGASLQADGSSRSVQCIYCQANNYLPDGLWFRLHPPSTVRTFFVVAEIGADQRMMAQLADEDRAEEIAKGDQLSPEVAVALASHEDSDVREALAENPLAPQEALRPMASDSSDRVRQRVAQHQLAPPDVLATLMNDSEDRVRSNAAANPATPREAVAARAATERDRDVLKAMLQRRGLHAELSNNPSKEAKELLLEDPNTPSEVLKTLAKTDDPLIQERVRKHKNAPGSVKAKAGCWTAAVVLGIALVAGVPLGIRFFPELLELAGLGEESADPDEFDAVESPDTMSQSERARHLDRLFGDFWDCYDEHDEGGEVEGKMVLVLDTEGEVAHTTLEGSVPEPVQECLVSKLESRSLTRYGAEEPALAIYQYSGSYDPNGVSMLSEGEELRLMEELEPEMRKTVVEILDVTDAEQGG